MSEAATAEASTTTTGASATSTAADTAKADASTTAAATATDKAAATADATKADPNAQAAAAKAAEDAAKAKAEGAPEKYEPFKAPEGVVLDDTVVNEFQATAKELNLSQANAQALVDKLAPVIAKQQGEHIHAQLAKADAEWLEASKADSEFGGANFDANMVVAKNAIEAFATPAFKQFLNDSRLGNHPEWVRFAYRVGKSVSADGKHVAGVEPGRGDKSLAEKLWPASQT